MSFLIRQTLIYAIPLMVVALAGIFAERSGIINLALEGIMIFGAFIGVLFVRMMQAMGWFEAAKAADNWVALQGYLLLAMLVAAILGAVFSLLLAFAAIPKGRPDHWRYGAEHAGARAGAVPGAPHRQSEPAAAAQG